MTLRHLKVFVCVCDENSITKAAEKLSVAQPAVSKTVSELEKYYGVSLFTRVKQRLVLTNDGKELLQKARNVIRAFEEFEETAEKKQNSVRLSVGASLTIGKTFMPDMIKKLKESFGEAEIKAFINRTSEIEKMIADGEIDFAFIEGTPSRSDIAAEEAASDMILAVAGKGYEVEDTLYGDSLKKYDFLLREKGSASRDYFESILTLNHIKVVPFLESASNQALISAAQKGLGIAVLPQKIVNEHIASGSLRQIKTPLFSVPRKSFVIYGKNAEFAKRKREIFEFCRNEFRKTTDEALATAHF
jgi:DNA-binding transcriptional LysR family regulator